MKRKRPTGRTQIAVKKPKIDAAAATKPTHPLLRKYYADVVTLREYLASRLKKKRSRRLQQYGDAADDDDSVCQLLDQTFIGTHAPVHAKDESIVVEEDVTLFTQQLSNAGTVSSLAPGTFNQSEIVDFAIWLLFRRNQGNSRPRHLLCHNFQRYLNAYSNGKDPEIVPGIPGIYSSGPNENAQTLRLHPWDALPDLLGSGAERILGDLLLDCGIFTPVKSSTNMVQLSGTPMCDLGLLPSLFSRKDGNEAHIVLKTSSSEPTSNKKRGLSDIRFARHRMLYANATFNAKGSVKFGLNQLHVLNRLCECSDVEETKHIMKYIFPSQFALHNVFTSAVDPKDTAHVFKDYTLREKEILRREQARAVKQHVAGKVIDAKATSLPKRLRGKALDIVHRLRKRHSSCAYSALLNHYCPTIHTQEGAAASSPQLATSTTQVSAFCRAATSKVFPKVFWGQGDVATRNLHILHRNIDLFVRIRRYESISLHDVLQNMTLGQIDWLVPQGLNNANRLSATDVAKRKEVMAELLYYLFDSFLIPLIRAHFHVTESSIQRNQLFYFRHDVWQKMSKPALQSLKQNMLEECNTEAVKKHLAKRTLGTSTVRLLPKEQGMRPIINLRRRVQKMQHGHVVLGKSINSILNPAFSVLNYEKGANPDRLGSAMFSVDEMFPRLQAFRASLEKKGLSGKPLYFAKVDVQACFDTIPQKGVMQLIKNIIGANEYQITRYSRAKLAGSLMEKHASGFGTKPIWRFLTKATPGSKTFDFGQEVEIDTAGGRTGTVFINGANQRSQSRRAVIGLLEEHIQSNLIKIGRTFYRQKEGIPQGSIVSSLLCSYFYAQMEREVLHFVNDGEGQSMLLRLIDDFLVISTDKGVAEKFIKRMGEGVEEYGIRIKGEKSRVNFDVQIQGKKVPRVEGGGFAFCGKVIDMRTLDLGRDLERRKNLSDSITVEYTKTPGQSFYRKTLNILKLQMHAMLLSTTYNSLPTVLDNLFQGFLEVAQKAYYYIKSLPVGKRPGGKLIIRTVDDLVKLSTILMRRRRGMKKGVALPLACDVGKGSVRWLACKSFLKVFEPRQTQFGALIDWLKDQIRLEKMARISGEEKRMLESFVRKIET